MKNYDDAVYGYDTQYPWGNSDYDSEDDYGTPWSPALVKDREVRPPILPENLQHRFPKTIQQQDT